MGSKRANLAGSKLPPVDLCWVGMLPEPQADDAAVFEGLLWFGIMVLAVLVGGVCLMFAKRRARRTGSSEAAGFTLDELRRLRDRGELTIPEYERLRSTTIEGLSRSTNQDG